MFDDVKFSDEYFMRQALREAEEAFYKDEVPVGAVVVVNNKIIAKGHNQVEMLNDSTAHAEILALTTAYNAFGSKYLPDATLYVTVEPCLMCCGAMYWGKIGKIVYGTTDEKNGYRKFTSSSPLHPKTEIIPGILAFECAKLMKDFFKNKR
ncbi:MAG: nucleoside deaminase [Flavobacterium sp.]|nr:nucleoside deaminase [Flavobacterium sp.]